MAKCFSPSFEVVSMINHGLLAICCQPCGLLTTMHIVSVSGMQKRQRNRNAFKITKKKKEQLVTNQNRLPLIQISNCSLETIRHQSVSIYLHHSKLRTLPGSFATNKVPAKTSCSKHSWDVHVDQASLHAIHVNSHNNNHAPVVK